MERRQDAGKTGQRPIPAWVWVACFALAGSAAGWADDRVWSAPVAIAGVLIGVGLTVAFAMLPGVRGDASVRAWTAAALRGASLGLAAWVFSLSAWLAMEISLAGWASRSVETLAGAGAGAIFGLFAAWSARRHLNVRRERVRRWLLGGVGLGALVLVVLYVLFTGPRGLSRYPDGASSPYRLPWPSGVTRLCVQSNRAIVSHRDWEEFAYDFAMPVGSDVCAARGGVVTQVSVDHDGNGFHAPNNFLTILHDDASTAWYLHLRRDGSHVQVGQRVRQGERIAASGNVGHSLLPHLHFHVSDSAGRLLPVTFSDVDSDAGIPRMFQRYTSGNAPPARMDSMSLQMRSAPH